MNNAGFIQEIERAAEEMPALFRQGTGLKVPSPKL
jgi:hypothetical protein